MANLKPPPKKAPATPAQGSAPQPGAGPGAPAGGQPQVAKPAAPKPAQAAAVARPAPSPQPTSKVTLSRPTQGKKSGPAFSAEPQDSLERIEDAVFALFPNSQSTPESPALRAFMDKVFPKLGLPGTSYAILKSFSSPDVTSEKVAKCLKNNPYFEFQFLKVIESMSKRETQPSLEAAVVMLGMQNSRNLIIALQMLRSVRGDHPQWGKDGKLAAQPKDVLKYALKAEEAVANDKSGAAEGAFATGLSFDLMSLIATSAAEDQKKCQAFIDLVFAHSLKTALMTAELAKAIPDFPYKRYAFAAGLAHDIGKAALAVVSGDYGAFSEDCSKRELPRIMRFVAEHEKYGVDHALLGAMFCREFRILRPLQSAVLYHHEPYLVKNSSRAVFTLSSIIALATAMASHFKKPEKADDPVILQWKGPELSDFKIEVRAIMAAANKIVV